MHGTCPKAAPPREFSAEGWWTLLQLVAQHHDDLHPESYMNMLGCHISCTRGQGRTGSFLRTDPVRLSILGMAPSDATSSL